jgi:RNA polymerase sigma-70 factor (ECF subfamily)
LVQETLINALPRLSAFESRRAGAIHAYFRQAILNRIRDEIRRTRRGPRFEALSEDHHGKDASPLEKAIGREALDRYETALSRLRPIEREAIIGRLELGYSFRDLAVALGKPSSEAARLTVTRAIVRLAQEMSRADS